jgi:hypothetical protein
MWWLETLSTGERTTAITQQTDLPEAAERIAALLAEQGIGAIVVGDAALAAHRYVRHTEGIDLGVNIAVRDCAALAGKLRMREGGSL